MSNAMVKYCHKDEHIPTMITRERVKASVWAGLNQVQIADILDIEVETLTKYYRRELSTTLHNCISSLGSAAITQALNGNERLLMFCLKTKGSQYGWQEKHVVEHGMSKELEVLSEQLTKLEKDNEREY